MTTETTQTPGRALRPHQQEAVDAATNLFADPEVTRGQVVMACGSGKTLVGQRITEHLLDQDQGSRVLVLFPSIALLGQTLESWRQDARIPFQALAFCSDTTTARNEDISAAELPVQVATDPAAVAQGIGSTDWSNGVDEAGPVRQRVVWTCGAVGLAGFMG